MKTPDERREYMRLYQAKRRLDPAYAEKNRASVKMWRKENREKANAATAAWRARNPEKVLEAQRAWTAKQDPEALRERNREAYVRYRRAHHLWNKFDMTPEQYADKLAAQGGGCCICEAKEPGGRGEHFAVDHDHETGQVRGLLCSACNHALGLMKDSPVLLRRAATYIEFDSGPKASVV